MTAERREGIEVAKESTAIMGRVGRAAAAVRRSRLRNVSLASRLSLLVLAVTIASLVVTSLLSLTYGSQLADDLLETRLTTLLTLKADRVDRYLSRLAQSTSAVAQSPATVEATADLQRAYSVLGAAGGQRSEPTSALTEFYRDQYAPEVESALGPAISWSALLPEESAAIYLQEQYTIGVPSEERALIDDAGDGSDWSSVHAGVHPFFREVRDRLAIDDIYLIDAITGAIVYSTSKQPDFATSLESGPYSGTTLAGAARSVRSSPDSGVQMTDLAPYLGSAGVPRAFMAAPVLVDGNLQGVLVFGFGADRLTEIMTSDDDWDAQGLGETGETVLVGPDGTLRSESRRLIEDPAGYLAAVGEAGTVDRETLDSIRATGTAVTFQSVADPAVLVDAGTEPWITTSYLGDEVYAAVRPLESGDLGWWVTAEMSVDEVEHPVVEFRRALLIAVALFVVAVTFATVAWARRAFEPVRAISERLRLARLGEPAGEALIDDASPAEFVRLSQAIDEMLDVSLERQRQVHAAAEERLAVMRSLLPSVVADRIEAGERGVLDDIDQATIVVATLSGIGPLLAEVGSETGRRRIADVVDRLDLLAEEHRLEPVKLIGDSYFAGCGLNRPLLDHIARGVSFGLAAVRSVREIDPSGYLSLSVGVATGAVTVGLTGSARLVYDLWGATVTSAVLLARVAAPNQVLVSEAVGAALPPELDLTRHTGLPGIEEPVFTVTVAETAEVGGDG